MKVKLLKHKLFRNKIFRHVNEQFYYSKFTLKIRPGPSVNRNGSLNKKV